MIEPSRWSRQRLVETAAVIALLGLYYAMAVSAAARASITFDELAHLTGGYSYWAFDDYRLHPENGNWPQRLGALPAVLSGASFPRREGPAWAGSDVYALGDRFLYASGNDAGRLLQRGRAVMALLGVALGALVFAWSRRLVSRAAGWVSLVLFCFSPTLLAHGALVTSDVASAFFFTAAAGAIWTVLHRVTPLTVLAAGVCVAGTVLSKLSAPILVPIAGVMVAVRLVGGRPMAVGVGARTVACTTRARQLALLAGVTAAIVLVTLALVWASFGCRYSAFAATTGRDTFLGQTPPEQGFTGRLIGVARQYHLLPEAYLYGASLTVQFASERAAFLNGRFSTTGWWWYFPYAFAVKTTIPALLLGVLALAACAVRWRSSQWYAATPLLALLGVYCGFALTTNLNIGERHLLPVYPALCVLAGSAASWLERRRSPAVEAGAPKGRARRRAASTERAVRATVFGKAVGIATLVLLGWHVVESVRIRPYYLAYVNQFAGGPSEGYRHLADSSLDWGQGLPALKAWLDETGASRSGGGVYLAYFGTARPEYYGVQATRLAGFVDRRAPEPPVPLSGGIYCISATVLDVIGPMFYGPEDEPAYQAAIANLAAFARASADERAWAALMRQTGEQYWRDLFVQFDRLRTGRLAAFLRQRQPDAMPGYSILVYRLSDADVERALAGPAPAR